MTSYRRSFSQQQGVGLVEVLIALLVVAIGVLGYAGLQLRALDSTTIAYTRSQATSIAQAAVERVKSNPLASEYYLDSNNWPTGEPGKDLDEKCSAVKSCTPDEIAAWDVQQLRWLTWNLLPSGRIDVSACVGSELQCVRVAWNETMPDQCEDGNAVVSDANCFVLEVLP
ncbi:type IV pilus modification protein PilV [Alcanivorax sp. NBRC 102024]|uniref:type IV pilus modification protein PilV n=1 Tax=Alcanivorax sp. NBRC 102024 TaxID=1113895 RepID=UPI000789D91D|nr:type IV pilus modification protein PilV [Alcanivorax sp. NBRC 102024]